MDPDLAYTLMMNAWRDNDNATAYEYADDLRAWLAGGGFSPSAPDAREWINCVLSSTHAARKS